jgi:hypothetical protein
MPMLRALSLISISSLISKGSCHRESLTTDPYAMIPAFSFLFTGDQDELELLWPAEAF